VGGGKGSLFKQLLGGKEEQRAAFSFCEIIMSQKKEAERVVRRGEVLPPDQQRNPGTAPPQGPPEGPTGIVEEEQTLHPLTNL